MKKIYGRQHKIILSFIISILCLATLLEAKDIANYTYRPQPLDIMFVVDYSNSMNSNDREKVGLQMIEAFIDETFSKEMRVGFVAYNQEILASHGPTDLNEEDKRKHLKSEIYQVARSGSTDTGLALQEAKRLLTDTSRQGIIILISDGQPDVSYSQNGRTVAQSLSDMDQVAKKCNEEAIPIYTIAFGQNFDGTTECLTKIATLSNGKAYTVHEAGDLVAIFNEIIEKYTMSSVVPIFASLASDDAQTIEIPLDSQYASEANLLLVSSEPIQAAHVWYEGQEVEMSQSEYYFTAKIKTPSKEKLKLQYQVSRGAYIKLYLVVYADVAFEVRVLPKVDKQSYVELQGYFIDSQTDSAIIDASLYERFKADATLITPGGTKEEVAIAQENGKLLGQLELQSVGEYGLQFNLKDIYYHIALDQIKVDCINTPPIGECELNRSYPHYLHQEIEIDLSSYFEDVEGDALSYSILPVAGESITYEIKENQLRILPQAVGKTSFQVVAADSEGSQVISPVSTITILPLWRYYRGFTVSFILILSAGLIGGLIYYVKCRKRRPIPTYNGKLNVYFTKTPEGLEVPPLTFSLFQMSAKAVTLEELLESAGYVIKNLEMTQVVFEPGFNHEIVFYHNTHNSVMIGANIACRKLKYSMIYGSKIYIIVPDESYEIEIHFMSHRN